MKKRWKRILLFLLIVLIILPIIFLLLLNSDWGQRKLTTYVSELLSTELDADVHIGGMNYELFTDVELDEVLISDHHSDTLLYATSLEADISLFELGNQKIDLSKITIRQGLFRLKTYQGEENSNLSPIIKKLSQANPDRAPWDVSIAQVSMEDMRVERIDENKVPLGTGAFDSNYLSLNKVHAELDEISFLENGVALRSKQLSLEEKSGLVIQDLAARIEVTKSSIQIDEMDLSTDSSKLVGDLSLHFNKDDTEQVSISSNLKNSKLKVSELGFFIPKYQNIPGELEVDASVSGQLNNLLIRDTKLRFGTKSSVYVDGNVRGLPDIDSLWVSAEIQRLESNVSDLHFLPVPGISELIDELPVEATRLGDFVFTGEFVGFMKDFQADGELDSELGFAMANMNVFVGEDGVDSRYDGLLNLEHIDLGSLLNLSDLGTASTTVQVSAAGEGRDLKANIKGSVHELSYKSFVYRNIEIDGKLEKSLFNGFLSINQAEANLDFRGLVDMRSRVPKFDFKAELYQADLGAIGLIPSLDSTSVTGSFVAQFEGSDLDDFQGKVVAEGFSYCREDDEFYFEDIAIESTGYQENRMLTLHSTPIDARLQGKFNFHDLKDDFVGIFNEVLPSLIAAPEVQNSSGSAFDYEVNFKDTRQIADIFLPGLSLSTNSILRGSLDTERQKFSLAMNSDSITYSELKIENLDMEMERLSDVAYLSLISDRINWGDSLGFAENYYTFNAYRDTIETDFTWSLIDKDASGSISAYSVFHSIDSISTYLNPSQVVMSGDYWLNDGQSLILYDRNGLHIGPTTVSNGHESVFASGDIGSLESDKITFSVIDFELEHFNKFLPMGTFDLQGRTNLSGHATSLLVSPTIVAELDISNFMLEGELVGDVEVETTWSRGEEFLNLVGGINEDGLKEVHVEGRYFPTVAENNFDAKLIFNQFDLSILNKFPLKAISNLGGKASGELELRGTVLEPDISGELEFDAATVKVDYLNTSYSFSDKVIVEKDYIGTNYIPITDEFGNKGNLNGTVIHENYRNWNYDIYAEFEKLLVLNTTAANNETFYGTVFGSGSVSVSGFEKNVNIEVHGRTEKGTVLELPLGNTSDVELEDFVYFKRTAVEDSLLAIDAKPTTGVELFLEAEVTPDAEIKLIFDEKIGDVIEGSGQGILTMTLNRSGQFEMFGNYMITQGDYLFTLQNVVNKRFTVDPGSTVSFFGDPYAAELNLKTIYNVRASLADLLYEYGEQYNTRVPVECQMDLDGPLLNPNIDFAIEFPGLNSGTETLAKSKINTQEELNKQVFSLLVLNKFINPELTTVNDGIIGATNTGAEFASAQLSNWLSQISDDLDIGVNYRAGDNITSEELAVALTTQLFNDRLLLSGNFGVQNAATSSVNGAGASSIIGDFRLEYVITKDGRLRLKVFNETNDNNFLNIDQAATQQGVGLIFQKEFDGLFDDGRRN